MNTLAMPERDVSERNEMLHPFEAAGLGVAPFRFVELIDTGRVSGGCDYCGTGIRYQCIIRDRNGRLFKVGTDCVAKTLTKVDVSIVLEVRKAHDDILWQQREEKRRREWQKNLAKRNEVRARLDESPCLFANLPHPDEYFAKKGLTLRDYYDWVLKNGGLTRWREVLKAIDEAHR